MNNAQFDAGFSERLKLKDGAVPNYIVSNNNVAANKCE